jgi:biopolymer transport protein ExbB/biopolymer transport protein TolQ
VIVERLLKVALLGSSWVLYLLLALSVVSLSAMLERWLFFRRHRDDPDRLRRGLYEALFRDDVAGAEALLAASPALEARVARVALRWHEGGAEAVSDVADSELGKVRKELERGMTFLGTLGNNAPFVGLLGTVIGVIEAFHQLGDAGNKGAMNNVMAGIAEALVATGVGLFVALPAVIGFNIFQRAIGDVEENAHGLCKLISAFIKSREHDEARALVWSSRPVGPVIEARELHGDEAREVRELVGLEARRAREPALGEVRLRLGALDAQVRG